ncbi:hypothetical protein B0T14DRAFT_197806 [Immersiella caudata]|uniref:Uncharacterized protein n=1 Tax=Immersiella caudata TaxID=314043 RepID=A0AA40BZ73_9PEZI|nr:hypothetical protein B0T14DRAFT_197806 [Immersiella caudata]
MKVVEWRIFEEEKKGWEHLNAREMVTSEDGKSLLSSDSNGTTSVWSLPRMGVVYRLLNEGELSADLALSPSGNRFYDIRGSVCNVWEPDALVRIDEEGCGKAHVRCSRWNRHGGGADHLAF